MQTSMPDSENLTGETLEILSNMEKAGAEKSLARQIHRFSVRSSPRRVELRSGRDPILTIQKEKKGGLRKQPPPQGEWDLTELPNPQNPRWMPYSLRRLVSTAIRQELLNEILQKEHQLGEHPLTPTLKQKIEDNTQRNHEMQVLTDQMGAGILDLIDPRKYQEISGIMQEPYPEESRSRSNHPITAWHYRTASNLGGELANLINTNPGPTIWFLRTRDKGPEIRHPGQVIQISRDEITRLGLASRNWRAFSQMPTHLVHAATGDDHEWAGITVLNIAAEAGQNPSKEVAQWAVQLAKESTANQDNAILEPNRRTLLNLLFKESTRAEQKETAASTNIIQLENTQAGTGQEGQGHTGLRSRLRPERGHHHVPELPGTGTAQP